MDKKEKQAPEGYRTVTTPSAVPFYFAAAVWVLSAFVLPMHRLFPLIGVAAVSAIAYGIGRKFFPGTTRYEKIEIVPKDEREALVLSGRKELSRILEINGRIANPALNQTVDRLVEVGNRIFDHLSEKEERLFPVRRFMNYYLPMTVKLLSSYEKAESQNVSGENIDAVKEKILGAMDMVEKAFERQLDLLFQDDVMDISTDITVFENLLKQEGLWETEPFSDAASLDPH